MQSAVLIELNTMLIFAEKLEQHKNHKVAINCWKIVTVPGTDGRRYGEKIFALPVHFTAYLAGTEIHIAKHHPVIPLSEAQAKFYVQLINNFRDSKINQTVKQASERFKSPNAKEIQEEQDAAETIRSLREKLLNERDADTPKSGSMN